MNMGMKVILQAACVCHILVSGVYYLDILAIRTDSI